MEVDGYDSNVAAPGGVSAGFGPSVPSAAAPAVISTSSREFLPFVEKYRPTSLDDLVSQNHIVTTS